MASRFNSRTLGSRGGTTAAGALAVGVAALLSCVSGAGAVTSPTFECLKRPTTTSEGAPSAAMLRTLGVLRRPQTAADALPAEFLSAPFGHGEGVFLKYVRLARVFDGTSYYIVPVAKGCNRLLAEEAGFDAVGPGAFGGYGGYSVSEIRRGRALSTVGKGELSTASGVVPDKVARVVLVYGAKEPNNPSSKRHHAARVTALVVNNVFAVQVPRDPGDAIQPSKIIWRTARGALLKEFRSRE